MATFKTLAKHSFLTVILAFSVVGCSSANYDNTQTPGMTDPIESVNRKIFAFNALVDKTVINPALDGYRTVVPTPVRKGINNALTNIQSPVYFANNLLQGDVTGAGKVLFSAIVNTFVGFGGLLDIAGYEGYETDKEDFGQTLAVWGINHGPYIVVPVFGPTTARDGSGYIIDSFADPIFWYSKNTDRKFVHFNKTFASYANARNNLKDALEELERSSIDYYASVRSSYYQSRETAISDGEQSAAASEAFDDFE